MKALVLSGGGALGAFEAGAIEALHRAGNTYDLICGTSIGAINASFVAQGKFEQLATLWHTIGDLKPPVISYVEPIAFAIDAADELDKIAHGNPFGIEPFAQRWAQIGSKKAFLQLRGFIKPDAIENILRQNLDTNALRSSLIVCATDLTRGSSDAFFVFVGSNAEPIRDAFTTSFGTSAHQLSNSTEFALAVQASAAIPGAFAPIAMNLGSAGNKEFVDGGVANNVPVTLATYAGANDITVIQLQPAQAAAPNYATDNLLEIGLASFTVMQQVLLANDMLIANSKPGVTIRYISPQSPLQLSVLGFQDQDGIDAAYAAGLSAAAAPSIL